MTSNFDIYIIKYEQKICQKKYFIRKKNNLQKVGSCHLNIDINIVISFIKYKYTLDFKAK